MSHHMLHVIVNGRPILEFDRNKPVPGRQRRYLDDMDTRMERGIQLTENQYVHSPDPLQRTQFVANSLVNALFAENDSLAIAMCTWLAKRTPDLKQIKAQGNPSGEMFLELVFDRDYQTAQQEQTIQFHKAN